MTVPERQLMRGVVVLCVVVALVRPSSQSGAIVPNEEEVQSELNQCPDQCSRHGRCLVGPNGHACQCDPGYHGENCFIRGTDIEKCPNKCSKHGSCLHMAGDQYQCMCHDGYIGYDCSERALVDIHPTNSGQREITRDVQPGDHTQPDPTLRSGLEHTGSPNEGNGAAGDGSNPKNGVEGRHTPTPLPVSGILVKSADIFPRPNCPESDAVVQCMGANTRGLSHCNTTLCQVVQECDCVPTASDQVCGPQGSGVCLPHTMPHHCSYHSSTITWRRFGITGSVTLQPDGACPTELLAQSSSVQAVPALALLISALAFARYSLI